MTLAMPVNPPLKWHGGKHYLAPRIIELMPPHLHYVEPYAGGLSVLLAKDPNGVSEVINDLNGDLTNFWRVLATPDLFTEFQRIVEATPFSVAQWIAAKAWISLPMVASGYARRAAYFFIFCRQSLAGRMKSFAPLSRTRTRRGMNEQVSAWLTAVEGLPMVHERLKRVVILNRDALDVIREQDGPDTLFYLDPPYLHETRASKDAYAYEMSEQDHGNLLALIRFLKGKVMLSGYHSPLYDTMLSEWNRHDFDLPNNAAGGDSKRRMTECVWSNF